MQCILIKLSSSETLPHHQFHTLCLSFKNKQQPKGGSTENIAHSTDAETKTHKQKISETAKTKSILPPPKKERKIKLSLVCTTSTGMGPTWKLLSPGRLSWKRIFLCKTMSITDEFLVRGGSQCPLPTLSAGTLSGLNRYKPCTHPHVSDFICAPVLLPWSYPSPLALTVFHIVP